MTSLKRTNSDDIDFKNLVVLLDRDLKIRDGEDHTFYNQFNKTDAIKHVIVFYENNSAVGCGAFREKENDTVEIKRMFVHPDYRKKGIASALLSALEIWAAEENYNYTILETGKKQPEAINLYQKQGYSVIPNYPPYENMDNSVCMKKAL
ncbi:GNAT family N-acetyltransferase [Flavobacterium aquidurense]|jgi:GNAT superfamily N-acetyltransferase|uniref:GNAT family N-acetyltransferase n=1 Tax=Flavobacterium aquidurense TaxID=362413 RepID=UPI0009153865|nr:GNAT family N-acetyltransferase [Flavobacterium aquidurense]OXA72028.1 GNAT family N-acetyltransferase [Flavobacterium aquidurense]SHH62462.1 Ribosomal protein S18 acetylase RimI [Flavobacterium frigidimaris]